jgi:hypothetical protein
MLLAILFLGTFHQVVFVGRAPTPREMEKFCYKIETIKPNLELQEATNITGRITDVSGEPLKRSVVEIRTYISRRKQIAVKKVTTDDSGYFDLGTIGKGKYRLLASPNRAWRQPQTLECSEKRCVLNITLQVNATDLLESICPVK